MMSALAIATLAASASSDVRSTNVDFTMTLNLESSQKLTINEEDRANGISVVSIVYEGTGFQPASERLLILGGREIDAALYITAANGALKHSTTGDIVAVRIDKKHESAVAMSP